jgi:hypothetical protein
LALACVSLGLYFFSRLEPREVEKLGPTWEYLYERLTNKPSDGLSPWGRRLVADVRAMGGSALFHGRRPGWFGGVEQISVHFQTVGLNEREIAQLVEKHEDLIWSFSFNRTLVPEAYLIHLKGLRHVEIFSLSDMPITDAVLDSIKDLPALKALSLCRTRVTLSGLARLKALPKLEILNLDGSLITEDSLAALAGASHLQTVTIRGVPLSGHGLELLSRLPALRQIDASGCGLSVEEVEEFRKSRPKVKLQR